MEDKRQVGTKATERRARDIEIKSFFWRRKSRREREREAERRRELSITTAGVLTG